MHRTNLKGAVLWHANLEGAYLGAANLEGTYLGAANLEGADLWNANLKEALYEPQSGTLPEILGLRSAKNLEMMRFEKSPHALEDLRREFKKVGYKEQERQITYAIKRSEHLNARERGDLIEPFFNYVFFDLPVVYGLRPGQALWILVSLIPGFALFYGVAIWKHFRHHGLYRLWPQERIETRGNEAEMADAVKLERLPRDWRHALRYAVYFSVLSAFHIGWRELNVGNWISRLQFGTYTLQATGWVRTLSGLQSLISVYLLAMWALTYFGRPFE